LEIPLVTLSGTWPILLQTSFDLFVLCVILHHSQFAFFSNLLTNKDQQMKRLASCSLQTLHFTQIFDLNYPRIISIFVTASNNDKTPLLIVINISNNFDDFSKTFYLTNHLAILLTPFVDKQQHPNIPIVVLIY
jgi:hypothetical protein